MSWYRTLPWVVTAAIFTIICSIIVNVTITPQDSGLVHTRNNVPGAKKLDKSGAAPRRKRSDDAIIGGVTSPHHDFVSQAIKSENSGSTARRKRSDDVTIEAATSFIQAGDPKKAFSLIEDQKNENEDENEQKILMLQVISKAYKKELAVSIWEFAKITRFVDNQLASMQRLLDIMKEKGHLDQPVLLCIDGYFWDKLDRRRLTLDLKPMIQDIFKSIEEPISNILTNIASGIANGNYEIPCLKNCTIRNKHFATIVEKAYNQNAETALKLIDFGNILKMESNSLVFIELFKQMKLSSTPANKELMQKLDKNVNELMIKIDRFFNSTGSTPSWIDPRLVKSRDELSKFWIESRWGDGASDEVKEKIKESNSVIVITTANIMDGNIQRAREKFEALPISYQKITLPDVVQRSYSLLNVRKIIEFAEGFTSILLRLITLDQLVKEMVNHDEVDTPEILLVDYALYQIPTDQTEKWSKADISLFANISRATQKPIDNALTNLANQIKTGKYGDDACKEYQVRLPHYTTLIQKAYEPTVGAEVGILEFSSCIESWLYDKKGTIYIQTFKEIELHDHMTAMMKERLALAINQLQIEVTAIGYQKSPEVEKELGDVCVKLSCKDFMKKSVVLVTIKLIKQYFNGGEAINAYQTLPAGEQELFLSEVVTSTYGKNYVIPLQDFASKLSQWHLRLKAIYYLVITTESNGHLEDPQTLVVGDYLERLWSTRNKTQAANAMEPDYQHISRKLNIAINKIHAEIATRVLAGDYTFLLLDNKVLNLLSTETILRIAYKPKQRTELSFVALADKLSANSTIAATIYIMIYNQMLKADHTSLPLALIIAQRIEPLTTQKYDNQTLQDALSELERTIPWHVSRMATERPLCIVNHQYKSDYLVVKEQYDTDRNLVMTVRNPKYNILSIRWRFVKLTQSKDLSSSYFSFMTPNNHNIYVGDDFLPCVSGRRRVFARMFNQSDIDNSIWEVHDFDWKNNLYLLYNRGYGEYLYADDRETLFPSAKRYVYTRKLHDPPPTVAVWRISREC